MRSILSTGNSSSRRRASARKTSSVLCGRPAARVDAAGRRWAFRYDADGGLVETIGPDGGTERFAYDTAGRLVEHHVPGQALTAYAYDERGQAVATFTAEVPRAVFDCNG